MSILFVAVSSLRSQNGYIVRISEEAKLITRTKSYLSIFVPLYDYYEYRKGVNFSVIDLLSEVFDIVYVFPSIDGINSYRAKSWQLKRLITKHNIYYIHAESTASGYILGKSKLSLGFTLDLHGFSEYETILRSNIKKRGWLHKKIAVKRSQKLDSVSIKSANQIVSVSNNMKKHLIEKYNIDSNKISVTPCLASNSTIIKNIDKWQSLREDFRDDYNIPSTTTVIGYIGGLGTYQMVEEMLDFFLSYYTINNNSLFIFVVIGNIAELKDMIERKKMKQMVKIFRDVPHQKVQSYLCGMDFGLLFRKNDPVNYYASPTKFGEYLSCGVSVIASLKVGDLSVYIEKNELGFGIKQTFKADEIISSRLNQIMQNRYSVANKNIEWVKSQYSWDHNAMNFPQTNE